jgi:protein HOOK2
MGCLSPTSHTLCLQGMALQQRAGEERASAHAQSFLAQQRLATNARRGPLGRLASLNLRPTDKHC